MQIKPDFEKAKREYEITTISDNVLRELERIEKDFRENVKNANKKKLQELYLDTIYFDEMYNLIISENSNFDDLAVKTIINESNTNYKKRIIDIKNILRITIMPTREAFTCAYLLASMVMSAKGYMGIERYEEVRKKYIKNINDKNKEKIKNFWEDISIKVCNVSDKMYKNISEIRSEYNNCIE